MDPSKMYLLLKRGGFPASDVSLLEGRWNNSHENPITIGSIHILVVSSWFFRGSITRLHNVWFGWHFKGQGVEKVSFSQDFFRVSSGGTSGIWWSNWKYHPGDSKRPFYPQKLEVTQLTFDFGSRFQHPKKGHVFAQSTRGGDFHFFDTSKVEEMIQLGLYLSNQQLIYWNYPRPRMPVTTRIIP